MKTLLTILPILFLFLASCKTAKPVFKMSKESPVFEVVTIVPSEDYCLYELKTKGKNVFRSHFTLRDTCDTYQLGQKLQLNVVK